jgi:hypothetical protein
MTEQEIHEYITSMKPTSYEDAVAIISMLPEDDRQEFGSEMCYAEVVVWVGHVKVSAVKLMAIRKWYVKVAKLLAEVYDY